MKSLTIVPLLCIVLFCVCNPVKKAVVTSRTVGKLLTKIKHASADQPTLGVRVATGKATAKSTVTFTIEADTQAHAEQHAAQLESQGCVCTSTGETSVECVCDRDE